MRFASIIIAVAAAFFALTVTFGSWYTVDEGERAVLLRNGAAVGVAAPGLGFKLPLIDGAKPISVRHQVSEYKSISAYSRDQQTANTEFSVTWSIPPDRVEEAYAQFGDENGVATKILDRQVAQQAEIVFGRYNALTAVQERSRLSQDFANALKSAVSGPIVIHSIQLEQVHFSDAYENSIEQRMQAEVEVQRLRQNAEREKVQAEIVVTQAKASADAVRQKAQADAEAIRIKGDAEAAAIKARGDALKDNPGLVQLTQAERWNGALPTTMIPGGATPMLNLGQATR